MYSGNFPCKSQSSRLRELKEEDIFIKTVGLIEDMLIPSRNSCLTSVRGAPDKDKYFKDRRLRMGLGNAPDRFVKLRSKCSNETKLPMELGNAPERDV
ncbi:hypothetical protein QQP08_021939 [Theobroma cacao]|nr:hypothetical protein QQP08_021939 [Theobroma cacao]